MTKDTLRQSSHRKHQRGFTLIELMIVVGIIGILAALAIPNFLRFQLKSKTAEAKVNLSAIRVVEQSYYSESGVYLAANPEPPAIPGSTPSGFDSTTSDFARLGWGPDGRVYFSYGVVVAADGSGYTIDAAADIDSNGTNQVWGYAKPDNAGSVQNGAGGCIVAQLPGLQQVGPCATGFGQSEF